MRCVSKRLLLCLPSHHMTNSAACGCLQNFIQDGTKGEDFNRNLYNPYLDFGTIHVYPQSLGVPGSVFDWVNDHYIGSRAVSSHDIVRSVMPLSGKIQVSCE